MNSRERIKKFYNILFYNLRTLVSFEIIYKLLLSFIFIPLVSFVFNLILKISGYNYITLENLSGFAMSIGIIVPGVSSTVILMLFKVYPLYLSSISTI